MRMFSKHYKDLEVDNIIAMNVYEVRKPDGALDYCHLDARIPRTDTEGNYRLGIYTFGCFSTVENANKFIDRLMEVRDSDNPPETFDIEKENALIEATV